MDSNQDVSSAARNKNLSQIYESCHNNRDPASKKSIVKSLSNEIRAFTSRIGLFGNPSVNDSIKICEEEAINHNEDERSEACCSQIGNVQRRSPFEEAFINMITTMYIESETFRLKVKLEHDDEAMELYVKYVDKERIKNID